MKNIKRCLVATVALLFTALSCVTAFAETIYIIDGYSYSISSNTYISLENWDTFYGTTLTLPDSLANRYFNNISNWAFENRKDIKGLDLSQAAHLQRIGYETFINCSEISTDLVLPESVNQLNERSFSGCSSIKSISILGNVTVIPTECFYNNSSAKSLVLPDSLKVIQSWAFGNCTSLEYAEIPKSVTSIAASSFQNDPNLKLGVWYDSYGYNYAKSKSIPFVLLDDVKLGDASGDGSVNINDVTKIQRYLAELETLEGIYLHAADANQDGTVDIADATALQMYIAEYDLPYPIGEVMTQ